jgi:hypothetical protein
LPVVAPPRSRGCAAPGSQDGQSASKGPSLGRRLEGSACIASRF